MSDYRIGDRVAVPGLGAGHITADLGNDQFEITWTSGITSVATRVPRPDFHNPNGAIHYAHRAPTGDEPEYESAMARMEAE